MLDRDLSIDFVLANPQVYNTGKTNSLLKPMYIAGWIFNAVVYAVVLNMLVFYVAAPTFEEWAVYPAGLLIFTALCNSLQMKVAFFHHQWAWVNWLTFAISLFGMLVFFLVISAAEYDFYYIANYVYLQGFYWFYAFFTVPLFVVFIDWFLYYTRMIFFPTNQMLYEEANRLVRTVYAAFCTQILLTDHFCFLFRLMANCKFSGSIVFSARPYQSVSLLNPLRLAQILKWEIFILPKGSNLKKQDANRKSREELL